MESLPNLSCNYRVDLQHELRIAVDLFLNDAACRQIAGVFNSINGKLYFIPMFIYGSFEFICIMSLYCYEASCSFWSYVSNVSEAERFRNIIFELIQIGNQVV